MRIRFKDEAYYEREIKALKAIIHEHFTFDDRPHAIRAGDRFRKLLARLYDEQALLNSGVLRC